MALTQVQGGMILASGQSIPSAALPVGSVLQVVNANYSTTTTTATATYTDTGLTATITPKFSTSKILIIVNQNTTITGTLDCGGSLNIVRNSTVVFVPANSLQNYAYAGASAPITSITNASLSYLDNPATTSATTYKTQQSGFSGKSLTTQNYNNISTITLMEIAA
jgi:hypothetical protein